MNVWIILSIVFGITVAAIIYAAMWLSGEQSQAEERRDRST